jgi:hypothetical protein
MQQQCLQRTCGGWQQFRQEFQQRAEQTRSGTSRNEEHCQSGFSATAKEQHHGNAAEGGSATKVGSAAEDCNAAEGCRASEGCDASEDCNAAEGRDTAAMPEALRGE